MTVIDYPAAIAHMAERLDREPPDLANLPDGTDAADIFAALMLAAPSFEARPETERHAFRAGLARTLRKLDDLAPEDTDLAEAVRNIDPANLAIIILIAIGTLGTMIAEGEIQGTTTETRHGALPRRHNRQ